MNIQSLRKIVLVSIIFSLVTACTARLSDEDGDGVYVSLGVDGNSHSNGSYYNNDTPYLRHFNMIDTYNTNSEYDGTHLALSAYANLGYFEIFWDIQSNDDYIIEILVNDAPYIDGAEVVSSEYCSEFNLCYDQQYQACDLSSDYTLSCETPNGYVQSTNISHFASRHHQDIYIILQTCDAYYEYCEYDALPVLIE